MNHSDLRPLHLAPRQIQPLMVLVPWIFIGFLSILAALLLWPSAAVQAQDTGPIWGTPFNVSDSPDASVNPIVVCDLFGTVHAFWSEKTQGEPSDAPGHDVGDSIFYRQLRDGEWSPAIDVAFADQNELALTQPVAATDSDGTIYLVWSGYRGVYFSAAPIASATSAAAWSPPAWIVRIDPMASFSGPVRRPRLIVDEAHHSLHVIYSLYGTNGNLFYLRSQDMGQTWDEPRSLTDVTPATSSIEVNADGRIILDKAGSLHVVWYYLAKEGQDWYGKEIKHVTSNDNGDTWSAPTVITVQEPGEIWLGSPDVVASADKLHVVFVCSDRPRRCYTYSQDGGQTWASRQRLFGDYQSIAGWDSMTVDMKGTVHLLTQLRNPQQQSLIWQAVLGPGGWPVEPSRIPYDPSLADHFPESCISLGNELHFVLGHESQGEVWHMSGQLYPTGAPALDLPVSMVQTPSVPSMPVSASTTIPTETSLLLQRPAMLNGSPARQSADASIVIVLSILPALLVVGGVVLIRVSKR